MTSFYVSLAIALCILVAIYLMVRRLPSPLAQRHRSKESDHNRRIAQVSGELVVICASGIAIICLLLIFLKSWIELPNYGFVISSLLFVLFLIEMVPFYTFSKYYMSHEYLYERENSFNLTN